MDQRVIRELRRSRGTELDVWARLTSDRHDRYRAAHPPVSERVCVMCVSNRPHQLANVAANVARQVDVASEFVFVPAGPGFTDDAMAAAFADLTDVKVVRPDGSITLGSGLNLAMRSTDARFVAKFDDDDHYGARFLVDSLRTHGFAGAGVVGKHTYYASITGVSASLLRFPGHEFSYSSTLAGGTLVIDRSRTADLRFDDVSLGEDRAFLRSCHRAGISTYAGDRFNFVQLRNGDNTWSLSTDRFLEGCHRVDGALSEHVIDR